MNKTAISWTDRTWNPWSGCTKVSAGCKYCYADALAEQKRGTKAFPNGFDVTIRRHKLSEPGKLKRPSLIFVSSMTDVFLSDVPDTYRDDVFAAMRDADWHTYQVLTKRPELALSYFGYRELPPHIWLGVTVESPATLARVETLRRINARTRFLSCEPLLGDVGRAVDLSGIHWVIGGGESGLHLRDDAVRKKRGLVERVNRRWVPRADRIEWARSLRDRCQRDGVAFFWKQWGGPVPHSAGRLLDGVEWLEVPSRTSAV